MKVNKKAAFSCSVPLDGEDVVVSSSSRGFCAFCRLLGNPLMPDLVIDRALGYVNLLLLLFFFLAPLFSSVSTVILAPYFLLCFGELWRWHDHKSKQRRLCDTSSARGQLRNFGWLWIGSETQPITSRFCLPVTPNFSPDTTSRTCTISKVHFLSKNVGIPYEWLTCIFDSKWTKYGPWK